jgi:hypothetical protein
VDDSCYIDNVFGGGVDAGTAVLVFVDQDGKLGTTALPNTGALPNAQSQAMLNELRKEQNRVAELEGTVARLAATVKEQAAQIQKVSAQLEVKKPAAKSSVTTVRSTISTRHISLGRAPVSRALPKPKSKDNLEELNTVPFSRVIRVERRTLYPCAIARRRPRVKHLEWIATIA